jgi:hypothetical protein
MSWSNERTGDPYRYTLLLSATPSFIGDLERPATFDLGLPARHVDQNLKSLLTP